eukprot:1503296-Rhodomonas_salina.5
MVAMRGAFHSRSSWMPNMHCAHTPRVSASTEQHESRQRTSSAFRAHRGAAHRHIAVRVPARSS